MPEKKTWYEKQFARALAAGQKRRYAEAITILEDLAARGLADPGAGPAGDGADRGGHPEIYLFLARAWHAEGMFPRAATCARAYIRQRPDDGSGWFFLGRTLLADGQVSRAVGALKKSLETNPQSVDARALLGMAYLKARKPSIARAVFEDALSLAPDDERLNHGYRNALFVEAVRAYKRGDAESSRQMLTFLINNDIDGVVPRLYLAHALRDLGYLQEALGEYANAASFAPDDESLRWYPVPVLLALGMTEEASAILASLGAEGEIPELSAEVVSLRIVKSNLDAGNWAAAAEAARSCIKQNGGSAQAHALMGEAQRNLGNAERAINHFNRAAELDRENPAPRYGILMVHLGSRDWVSLRRELAKAERSGADPDTVRYYGALCDANLDGDPAAVLPVLQDEVRRHGAVGELMLALARTYFRLGLADLAVGWYARVVEGDPANEVARIGHIACLEELGDARALTRAYSEYLASWPDNSDIRGDYYRHLEGQENWEGAADQAEVLLGQGAAGVSERQLALYRRKAGQFRKAAILYRNILRQKPDDRPMLYGLVYCLDRMGEAPIAAALMREANRAYKPDVEALLIESRLLARSGDLNSALATLRVVVDKFPRDPRGWREMAATYRKRGVASMAAQYEEKARDAELALTRKRRPKSGT